jgi:hypothetical protein
MMREDDPDRAPAGADAISDLAVAQVLALARAADVEFELTEGRLAIHFGGRDRALWTALRPYLDEIGVEAIARFLGRTTEQERARLMAVPAPPSPRQAGHRLPLW